MTKYSKVSLQKNFFKKITQRWQQTKGVCTFSERFTHKPDYINHDRHSFLHTPVGRNLLRAQNVGFEAAACLTNDR